jgi:hypothetical protein
VKLTLTTKDGEILAQWDVDDDFGDVTKPMARIAMTNEIVNEILRAKECGEARRGFEKRLKDC